MLGGWISSSWGNFRQTFTWWRGKGDKDSRMLLRKAQVRRDRIKGEQREVMLSHESLAPSISCWNQKEGNRILDDADTWVGSQMRPAWLRILLRLALFMQLTGIYLKNICNLHCCCWGVFYREVRAIESCRVTRFILFYFFILLSQRTELTLEDFHILAIDIAILSGSTRGVLEISDVDRAEVAEPLSNS